MQNYNAEDENSSIFAYRSLTKRSTSKKYSRSVIVFHKLIEFKYLNLILNVIIMVKTNKLQSKGYNVTFLL